MHQNHVVDDDQVDRANAYTHLVKRMLVEVFSAEVRLQVESSDFLYAETGITTLSNQTLWISRI